jgi:hypothetical protein
MLYDLAGIALLGGIFRSGPADIPFGGQTLTTVRLSHTAFAPGDSGLILVDFSLPEGMHVNAEPAVEINLPAQKRMALRGAPELAVKKETEILNTDTPVRQWFTISPNAKPATTPLDVIVTYLVCSDTEGWCRMRSDTCHATLFISHP